MNCDVCGERMCKTVWEEESWGRVERVVEYECLNPQCGEEDEDDE